MQRRAINLAQQKIKNRDEEEEIACYKAFRLNHYLLKKATRNYDKKIVYETRKRVADRRIRYQGRFINECQARELLGLVEDQHTFE
jgi:hypothetical protein